MAKCLVVYGSKYGSTREVAAAIAAGLGADLAMADTVPDLEDYELIVIGSPIYAGEYLNSVIKFIRARQPALRTRKVAAFITAAADMHLNPGLTGEEDEQIYTQQDYAEGLGKLAGGELVASRGFGGRLVPDQLDERDRKMLNWFYRFLMRQDLTGFDLLDLPEARRWGEQLKQTLSV